MASEPADGGKSRSLARMQALNFAVDLLALLTMMAIAATGLLLRYVLPPGVRGGRGMRLSGLSRHEWGDIHFWLAVALAVLIVVHVALHWTWVCAVLARWCRATQASPGRRTVYGIVFLIAVALTLGGFVWLARANVTEPAADFEHGGGRGYRGGRNPAVSEDHNTAAPNPVFGVLGP